MRTIITFIGSFLTAIVVYGTDQTNDYNTVLYGPRAIVDPDMQGTVDSWFKGAKTNNIVCAVSFAPIFEKGSPVFYVNLVNTTTNYIRGLLVIPIQNRANIELLDAGGKSIPKTEAGKKFNVWNDQQIRDWFEDNRERPPQFPWSRKSERDTKGIADILFPLWPNTISYGISLPQLFQIEKAGEYELHFQMRMAQTKVNTSGKVELNIFWLPEVVAKIQIKPEDILSTNLTPTSAR
jgi:hypothetical protein